MTRIRLLTDGGTPLSAMHSYVSLQRLDMLCNVNTWLSSAHRHTCTHTHDKTDKTKHWSTVTVVTSPTHLPPHTKHCQQTQRAFWLFMR